MATDLRTRLGHVELPNPGGRLRPDMFGTLRHVKARRQTKRTVQSILLEAMKRKEQGLCPIPQS